MPTGVRYGNEKRSDSMGDEDDEDDEGCMDTTRTSGHVQMMVEEEESTKRNKVDIQAAMALAALTGGQAQAAALTGEQAHAAATQFMHSMQATEFMRQQQQQHAAVAMSMMQAKHQLPHAYHQQMHNGMPAHSQAQQQHVPQQHGRGVMSGAMMVPSHSGSQSNVGNSSGPGGQAPIIIPADAGGFYVYLPGVQAPSS